MEPISYEEFRQRRGSSIGAFLEGVERSHLVIVLLWKNYSQGVKEEYEHAVNLFKDVHIFIKQCKKNQKQEKKLKKLEEQIKNEVVSIKSFGSLSDLEDKVRISLGEYIYAKIKQSIIITHKKDDLYYLLTKIIKESNNVIQLSRTPILIFGPRPYDEKIKIKSEEENYRATIELLQAVKKGEKSFTCIISSYETIQESKEHKLNKKILSKILDYKKLSEECGNFSLYATRIEEKMPLTFIVGDHRSALWLRTPGETEDVCVTSDEISLRNALLELEEYYKAHNGIAKLIQILKEEK